MRINLFGGPGSGKSTTAAWLFSELKCRLVSVELVPEYVKTWAYQGKKINTFDAVYIFGKQQQYEYRFLTTGVKNIVTDSPCWLSPFYTQHQQVRLALMYLNRAYDQQFDSLNIFLNRKDKLYVEEGRYQNEPEAKQVDIDLGQYLQSQGLPLYYVDYNNRQQILDLVISRVNH